MNESLMAAAGQFEQVLLAEMFASASFTATPPAELDGDEGSDDAFGEHDDGAGGFAQLMSQALASAVERAGGIGIRDHIASALARQRS